jgi:hypothetical protein
LFLCVGLLESPIIILFRFFLADWKLDASRFATIAAPFLAIFVIDSAVLPYLNSTSTPIFISLNVCGFTVLIIGIVIIYVRRWPKIDEKKVARIAIQHVQSKHKGEGIQILETKYVGLKWRVRLEYYANTMTMPLLLIIDAGTGNVESEDASLDLPTHLDFV